MTSQAEDPAPDEGRLDELDERIRKVRSEAEDVVTGSDDEPGERYSESGDDRSESEDDQTIAPPG